MIRSRLTDRWQTTIPAKVRKALGLKPRQQLKYELRDGGVFIRPECEGLSQLFGALGSEKPHAGKEKEREAARGERAARHRAKGQ